MKKPTIDSVVLSLRSSKNCLNAVGYYRNHYRAENPDEFVSHYVLERGATDFDQPYDNEDGAYKVEAYIHTYLDMHYRSTLEVFKKCEFLDAKQPCLLIDYGCGPMTAGLALLKRLDLRCAKQEIAYYGVDVSARMREKCESINQEHCLYTNTRLFSSIGDAVKDAKKTISDYRMVVVNFGFVLSESTHKTGVVSLIDAVINLADVITDLANGIINANSHIYVVYQNPSGWKSIEGKNGGFHGNWKKMQRHLAKKLIYNELSKGALDYGAKNSVFHEAAELIRPKTVLEDNSK